ncbi:hypothetical protein A6U88_32915 [Agrobacterium sp. B131/95]|nr:hypothetical protein A6U88_32915 [Agrobacterium sp. B131/95]
MYEEAAMSVNEELVKTASHQWERWGFSVAPLHKPKAVAGSEEKQPFVGYVHDYWVVVNRPERNGLTDKPWSAAFISFCFRTADPSNSFPYNEGHYGYCQKILKGMKVGNPKITIEGPTSTILELGDLIWAGRTGTGCGTPPQTYDAAMDALRKKDGFFCSHADIVVAIRPGEVDVIGGNVSDSVTKTTYITSNGKIVDPRHAWVGVIRNTI